MIRQACSVAQNQAGAEGNIGAAVCFFVLRCLIAVVDWAVQFLNRYAFVHIALYGKPYLKAAKDTWK